VTADRLHTSSDAVSAEPRQGEIQVPRRIAERVASLAAELGNDLESAVYFEHPFAPPGLMLLIREGVESLPDLLARVYRALPPGLKIACLRRRELFELALPGFAAPPLALDEQPHLAYCVKFRSALLHGDLPFSHPPELHFEHALTDQEGLYFDTLVSPLTSRLTAGVDVRKRMSCDAGALRVARCTMFALRRRFLHPLAAFLHVEDLSPADQETLAARMGMLAKNVPVVLCAALGRSVDDATALGEMRRLLPDFDFGVLDEIVAIRRGERSFSGLGELKDLLRRLFDLLEPLNERILTSGAAAWQDFIVSLENS
jgi:hypothetical protein